ncbi:hypothetical protein [uncultured Pseudodesulfovibrio sp.]|uniref:hypothetical protein n=1 Tax=uncultured Pseudodesulfovibrio sp. TaxID=2035858 RepID=UPI00374A0357
MNLINTRWPPFKPASHYQWLFYDTPTPTTVVCAEHRENIVGLFALHERQLQSGELCGTAGALVIEDDYRGMGLFKALGDEACALSPHLDVLCSVANPYGGNALAKNFGYQDFGAVVTMTRPVAADDPSEGVSLEKVSSSTVFDGDIALPPGTTGFTASAAYQGWRYGSGNRYAFYKSTGQDTSYIILKLFPKNDDETMVGDIMGIFARDWDPRRIVELIRSTVAASARLGVREVYAWAGPEDPYAPLLAEAGFTPREQPERRLCVLPLENKTLLGPWHVTMSDSMR